MFRLFSKKAEDREKILPVLTVFLIICSVLAIAWLREELPNISEKRVIASNIGFYLLINLNIVVVMVLSFLVIRNIVKLVLDRKKNILGSRLRTRLMVAFVGLSLVPTALLFVTAKGIVDNILEGWFSPQIVSTVDGAVDVATFHYKETDKRLKRQLAFLSEGLLEHDSSKSDSKEVLLKDRRLSLLSSYLDQKRQEYGLAELALMTSSGELKYRVLAPWVLKKKLTIPAFNLGSLGQAKKGKILVQPEQSLGSEFIRGYSPLRLEGSLSDLVLVGTSHISPQLNNVLGAVVSSFDDYRELHSYKRPLASSYLLTLVMVMLLIVISAMWIGFYLARSLTVPIQNLAEGIEEIAGGNLDYQIQDVGDDELGFLVHSFNTMTGDLKQTTGELESRRRYMETILESVDLGVMSISAEGFLITSNSTAASILGVEAKESEILHGIHIGKLLPGQAGAKLEEMSISLFDSADRLISGNIFLKRGVKEIHLHVTLTKLVAGQGESAGAVILFDDLTELVRAQRLAAWREVARRIAHEIKNPLTPIQLSAQRINKRFAAKNEEGSGIAYSERDRDFIKESTEVIVNQVATLRTLVNEFSKFARMPSAELHPLDLNSVVQETVSLYRSSHPEIKFEETYQENLPPLSLDKEQIGRVLANLFDNALSALSVKAICSSSEQKITANSEQGLSQKLPALIQAKTFFDPRKNTVSLSVSDSGPGIPEGLKTRIFEPYFTSKKEGTGLGLAIVSSIVADHGGTVLASDNKPTGACFTLEFPVSPIAPFKEELSFDEGS